MRKLLYGPKIYVLFVILYRLYGFKITVFVW